MAISRNNPFTQGLSGLIGGTVVFRQCNGRTIVANRPRKPRCDHPKLKARREKFKEAALFAKGMMQMPEGKVYYTQMAERLGFPQPNNAAVKDYMNGDWEKSLKKINTLKESGSKKSAEAGKTPNKTGSPQVGKTESQVQGLKCKEVVFGVEDERLGERKDVTVRERNWRWDFKTVQGLEEGRQTQVKSENRSTKDEVKIENRKSEDKGTTDEQDSRLKIQSSKLEEVRGSGIEVQSLKELGEVKEGGEIKGMKDEAGLQNADVRCTTLLELVGTFVVEDGSLGMGDIRNSRERPTSQ